MAQIAVAALAIGAATADAASSTQTRPNVVLILCDDLGWSDIGCYGGEIPTPHLDRLAAGGLRFTQFYNNAKCTTTRASLITGLYPRPTGGDLLRADMVTLGEALGAAGYRTGLFGKWHLGHEATTHPRHRGFDAFYGLLDGCCNFFDPGRRDPPYKGGKIRRFADGFTRVTEFPDGYYTTDAFTDRAIAWIESDRDSADARRPYFLHLCYTAPHYPLHAPPEDIARQRGRYREGWDQLRRDRFERQRTLGLADDSWRLSTGDSRAYDWADADQDFEDLRMAVYAAMVTRMDHNIGRVIATLRERGELDNTLVLFLSDNGGCAEEPGGRDTASPPGPEESYRAVGPAWGWAQNAPFRRYKTWMHEGGIATPLIAHWPAAISGGDVTDAVGHVIDFFPTLLELAQSEPEDAVWPLEGTSLAGALRGEPVPQRQLAWEFNGCAALREGDWKIVWDRLDPNWQLYNLSQDRTETADLASKMPERVACLEAAYNRWAIATGNEPHGSLPARRVPSAGAP